MTSNLGAIDRILRLVLGVFLVSAPFIGSMALFESTIATTISVIAGAILIATSAMRFCPLYRVFGIKTCKL